MEFRILGPLEVVRGEQQLTPRRAKQRALLATLVINANEVVGNDQLIEAVWGDSPPDTAQTALHGHVSFLRKQLGSERIETRPPGYRLRLEPGELDLDRFEALFGEARGAVDPASRAELLREALALWRGEPLADFRYEAFAQSEIVRLDALRLAARELAHEAELELGRHRELLPELERLVAENPLAERSRAQLMLALYRADRQAEALRVYQEGRRRLADELGIDPGPALQTLERQILRSDPALAPPRPEPVAPRQERKLVTILVAERTAAPLTDPEDLEHLVAPALERCRTIVERFGGTVEPLFSNALLGIFGAPRAHEDDAERAVRAALELDEMSVGIESGEALVTTRGETVAVTGDVLTAASHVHAAARPGTVLVGESAYRATKHAIAYVRADGAWRPTEVRARLESTGPAVPFVGRDEDLALLEHAFARACRERSLQLVTVTAEPGGGKTRLVAEFRSLLESTDRAVTWRQGRCLPYGDGVTYWALGEIVKAQTGILESDDADESARKLRVAVADLDEDRERRAWLERSVAPLVGLQGDAVGGDREQSFAAWQHFIESIAAQAPLVLVLEDVHWADVPLIEFVQHLAARATATPIVALCTARLEFLDAHPRWGGGQRNAHAVALAPLTDDETERLLGALIGRAPTPTELRRAGGNPLFAHELARLDAVTPSVALPDSLHALIAARLDSLAPELKELAADAAVVGETFWSGALASMSETALPEVEQRLHRLVARDVARRVRMSSVQHQTEFAFLHVLVRDVAYAQIPRAGRMRKHRAAAEWVEQLAGDRVTDHAELLAHHYVCALDLARLVGAHAETEELATRARRFLELAGDRAYALDVEQAETYYRRALDLTPPSDESRGRVLARLSEVVQLGGRLAEAERLSEAAIDAFRSHGNLPGAGEAMVTLATASWRQGKTRRSSELLAQAVELLERQTHGPELAAAYSRMAMTDFTAGKPAEGLRWAEKALALARRLRLEAVRARALQFRGMARFELGDLGGLEDLREALQLSLSGGFGFETGTSYSNLADLVWVVDGPVAGLELKETALAFTEQRGIIHHSMFVKVEMLRLLFDLGEWDALLGHAEDVLAWDRGDEPSQLSIGALPMKARVLLWRGETAEASGLELDYLPLSREIGDPQMLVPALATAAAARLARGDTAAALALVEELEAVTYRGTLTERVRELPAAARIRAAAKAAPAGLALLPADDEVFFARGRHSVASARAALTEATGELEEALNLYSTAAEGWRTFGCVPERAQALLGQGRCLLGLGRRAEAAPLAREAHELATSLGALPLIAEAGRIGLRAPRE